MIARLEQEVLMALKLRKLSYALGAEVCDIDVSKPMTEQQFGEIYRAFLDNNILLLRNQDITREQHIEFSRRFGELDRHDSLPRDRRKDHPELLMVTNEPKADGSPSDTKYTGRQWHTDMSFTTEPSLGSLLKSYAVPEVGGDTLFANLYLAYDTLSEGMKKMIAPLHGIHLSGTRKLANDNSGVERMAEQKKINPPVAQPVVRVHPETGRKALYLGEKVKRFDGMTEAESKPLIDFLNRHATKPEFLYRHQWRKNDILVWDNRCTLHQALGDFDETQLRHMERTTVLGTPSGYVVAEG
jgi:taurine dioxygenase